MKDGIRDWNRAGPCRVGVLCIAMKRIRLASETDVKSAWGFEQNLKTREQGFWVNYTSFIGRPPDDWEKQFIIMPTLFQLK